jgi:type IV secretory pathway VirB4 component
MQINGHRMRPQSLADLLLYDALIDDGILIQQDGSLMAAWSFCGPDLASATHAEMAVLSARLNSILRLGSGWMIQCDVMRTRAPEYPESGAFPDPITRLIDDERRQQFLREGAHFESEHMLTLTYLPPSETEQNMRGWLFEGQANRPSAADQALSHSRRESLISKRSSVHFSRSHDCVLNQPRENSESTSGTTIC